MRNELRFRASHGLSVLLALTLVASSCSKDDPVAPGMSTSITKPLNNECIVRNQPVSFSSSTKGGFGNLTYKWAFDGGTPATSTDEKPTGVVFPTAGTFGISLEVRDMNGNLAKNTISIRVQDACADLSASIDIPAQEPHIFAGESVDFSGACVGGVPPHTLSWSVGAVAPPFYMGSMVTIQFPDVGTYPVIFTCVDSRNDVVRDTLEVHVAEPMVGFTPGVFSLNVTNPDGISVLSNNSNWADIGSSFILGVAGQNGVGLFDPTNGMAAITAPFLDGTAYLGTTLLSGAGGRSSAGKRQASSDADAVYRFGASGGILTPYYPPGNDWGAFSLLVQSFSFVLDGVPYAGTPAGQGLLSVTGTEVLEIEFDDMNLTWGIGDSFPINDFPGNASIASAFARGPGGSFLVATNANPGNLYRHGRVAGVLADVIGTVGSGARRLRCTGNVCAVTNFDSDDITVVLWDTTTDAVQIVGQVPVGDGPVGVDLLDLGSGKVAILTTGFNDNSYSVTVVDSNGQVVSNDKLSVDPACGAPAHAAWARDADKSIVISCNATGNIQVVASGL